jgi:hypothetical protein
MSTQDALILVDQVCTFQKKEVEINHKYNREKRKCRIGEGNCIFLEHHVICNIREPVI